MNLVPDKLEIIAENKMLLTAALNTPFSGSGLFVFLEKCSVILDISLFDSMMFVVWTIPERFIKSGLFSPAHSIFFIVGSERSMRSLLRGCMIDVFDFWYFIFFCI